jgi:hypothetical protein
MTLVFAAHRPRCASIRALPRKQARKTGAVRVACAGAVQLEQAQELGADAGLRRHIVKAALSLKQRGWAVVDDVLPQCAPQTRVSNLVQLRRSAL